ncbi:MULTISPECIES: helix-turn-helix domain-containing protein [Sporomusa]|uniref:helix-turn-helix domain-containing protein n=1 Tax=Sporomusa TaxID=2375 RepID=UPI00166AB3E0|nr:MULTISPECIES: helix-turn-helix transcriptional regulator [Sporomusa]MCM0759083.1 helix-turn-helix domain-containing protein [Sporomusa sphaeroides DSM 2875]
MPSFGERLNQLRKLRDLKAEDLADVIGVKRRIIYMYEKNESKPSFEVLISLADYFDVSLDYLVGRSDKARR